VERRFGDEPLKKRRTHQRRRGDEVNGTRLGEESGYWRTSKLKAPSVVCVSTERTRHFTR
jgi:hypothetical protein